MKGDLNMIILAIFAIVVGAIFVYMLIPKVAEPSMKVHGNQQAYVLAKIIASSINALSYTDEGEILKSLDVVWDIDVTCETDSCTIRVSYERQSSENIGTVKIIGEVEEFSEQSIKYLKMVKEPEKSIRLEGISEWDERI